MDGVATPIIGRPRPLPGHDTPNPAYHPHTLNCEEPANTTLQLIANDLGVSRQRLAVRLRERGVAIRGEGPSREQVLEMVRRYSQGESLAKVGTRLGFSGGTVRAYLIRAGVPIRDAQGRSR